MKFRIKKDYNGLYFAEYKKSFFWFYLSNSSSFDITKTKEVCEKFKTKGKDEIIESFEL